MTTVQDGKYFGPCPKCGILLGFGHLPETCESSERDAAFRKWCCITITDETKAPKSAALVKAYKHAWDAAWQARATSEGELEVCWARITELRQLLHNFTKEHDRAESSGTGKVIQCDCIQCQKVRLADEYKSPVKL
jgi:hypothetical protein